MSMPVSTLFFFRRLFGLSLKLRRLDLLHAIIAHLSLLCVISASPTFKSSLRFNQNAIKP